MLSWAGLEPLTPLITPPQPALGVALHPQTALVDSAVASPAGGHEILPAVFAAFADRPNVVQIHVPLPTAALATASVPGERRSADGSGDGATDPLFQGRGVGKSLVGPMLERADGVGVPTYLETQKESNLAYYQRFGFNVIDEFSVDECPPVWTMQREPR